MRCLAWIVACALIACRAHAPVEAPRFTLDETHPIVGRVVIPAGTPEDEHVELALESPGDLDIRLPMTRAELESRR